MKCELLHYTPLYYMSNGCRMSHDSFKHSDDGGTKDRELIKRIGVKMKHESILEFGTLIYDVEMSTKTLLAFSRHRVGISLTMRSTRYTTKKNAGFHTVQATINTSKYLTRIMKIVNEAINEGLSNDEISLLLPQAYVYRGQVQFNVRSLLNFCKLRITKEAHPQIRMLAEQLVKELPDEYKYLFEEYINEN